jgi:HEAT repeat protein
VTRSAAKKPRKTPEEKLAELDEALAEDTAGRCARIGAALRDKHYRIVAKAARLSAEGLHYDLVPALIEAYRRFLDKPAKNDPTCFAKKALLRALVELDCDDVTFYGEALRYRQPEPVWGGSVDTAVEVRTSAAMGLVATGYARALVDVTTLLYDKEHDARAGAARAVACGNPREAELVLRGKILAGDEEPTVLGECFSGLLAVAPEESVDFVAAYLDDADEELREQAALALGASKLDAALERIVEAWNRPLPPRGLGRTLLQAAALNRSPRALEWLGGIVAHADLHTATDAVEVLAAYKFDAKLAAKVRAAVDARGERGERELALTLAARWGNEPAGRSSN